MPDVGHPEPGTARSPALGLQPAPAGSPSPALRTLLISLTAATGLIDAVSYLGVGHVFVANMTGNVVLLGFALSGAPGLSITASLAAVAGFLAGACAGGRWAVAASGRRRLWLSTGSAAQTVLVGAAAAATVAGALRPDRPSRLVLLALLGIAMGLQNATVRRLAIPDLTTTVLTQMLTGLAADSSVAGGSNPRSLRRIGAVVAMLVGALAGGALTLHEGLPTALAVTAVVFAVVTVGFAVVVPGTDR
ncbi:MAG: hypothetical protein JWQ37_2282 [Blastococcus sp.]|nr:hypothetical protein [Blastococcus sp.]